MDPLAWDDQQVKEAAEKLAVLSVAVKMFDRSKEAASFADTLSNWAAQAKDYGTKALANVPESARNPLLYAGIGAAGGGLLGGLSSFSKDKEERRPFRSALSGALAGAAGGAGLGLLQDHALPAVRDYLGSGSSGGTAASGGGDLPAAGRASLSPEQTAAIAAMSPEQQAALQQSILDQRNSIDPGSATATSAGAIGGAVGGVKAMDFARPQHVMNGSGLGRSSGLLSRGVYDIKPEELYKNHPKAEDFVRTLQQPGGVPLDRQNAIINDAITKQQILPPADSPATIGRKVLPTGESAHVPGVSREEIRSLAQRGRVNSRAGWKSRAAGGVAGGLLGGMAGDYLYDQAKGLLQ